MVLYRKYRPQRFAEVVGQEPVVQTLRGALKLGSVAHGYLFTGPRGSGKTTLARLLAKAVNCANLSSQSSGGDKLSIRRSFSEGGYDACGICDSCKEIEDGRSVDLIEIDAASNRGIDEIRELRESARFASMNQRHKVYIIDEVHMLTKEAFNALLKTLEEPPAKVIFVLATTEAHKVPATILSRVQRFDFKKITAQQIVGKLAMIAESEGIKITPEALRLLAMQSEGSLRDAESALTKLAAYHTGNIDETVLSEVLGIVPLGVTAEFVGYLLNKQTSEATALVNHLHESGVDLDNFTRGSLEYVRRMLVAKANPVILASFTEEMGDGQAQQIATLAGQVDSQLVLRLTTALLRAQQEMKTSPIPQLPLEMAIIELAQ